MRQSFLPNTDGGLRGWALNMASKLDSGYASYGVSQPMAEEFRAVTDAYVAALQTAVDPSTRTMPNVNRKNAAREVLKNAARLVVSIVRGQANVNDSQKIQLGLTIPATTRTAIPVPDRAPLPTVQSVRGHTVTVALADIEVARRGRPPQVKSALVMTYVGEQPPTHSSQWTFACNTGKTSFDIVFDASVAPGAVVWVIARWQNPRSQGGPWSNPLSTRIQGGGIEGLGKALRIAA